jgi:hypothetical protein
MSNSLATHWQHISNTLATHWQHMSNSLATHWQHISNTPGGERRRHHSAPYSPLTWLRRECAALLPIFFFVRGYVCNSLPHFVLFHFFCSRMLFCFTFSVHTFCFVSLFVHTFFCMLEANIACCGVEALRAEVCF